MNPSITACTGILIISVCIEFKVRKSRKIKPWRILKLKIERSSELYCQTTLAIEYRHRRSFCIKIIQTLFSRKKRKEKELQSLLGTLYVFLCQLYFCKTTRVYCSVHLIFTCIYKLDNELSLVFAKRFSSFDLQPLLLKTDLNQFRRGPYERTSKAWKGTLRNRRGTSTMGWGGRPKE